MSRQAEALIRGKREQTWRRAVHFHLIVFCTGFCLCALIVALPDRAIEAFGGKDDPRAKGLASFWLGLSNGAKAFAGLVAGPSLGSRSDVHGRKSFVVGGEVVCLLSYLPLLAPAGSTVAFAAYLALNALSGFIPVLPALLTVVTDDQPPERRARGFGLLMAVFDSSFLIVPALTAALSHSQMIAAVCASSAMALLLVIAYGESLPVEQRVQGEDLAGVQISRSWWKPQNNCAILTTTSKWESPQKAWDALHKELEAGKEVAFFEHMEIALDGGLSEIGNKEELWYSTRWLSAAMVLIFVFYNVYFILTTDISALQEEPTPYKEYLLTASIASKIGLNIGAPQKCVSALELLVLACLVLKASWHVFRSLFSSGLTKWRSVAHLCWFDLPDLSSYSAIKMLQYVTPQQLSYDLNFILWYASPSTKKIKLLVFLLFTPTMLVLGLDCFLLKVRQANGYLMSDEASQSSIMGSIILLNQILGVVQIGKTIKNRLYRFVFAGEDGMMTAVEQIRQDVWEAMIADKMFQSYPAPKAAALMLSWGDDDFQMMALNDKTDPAV